MVSLTNIAWAAGIYEGEGSFNGNTVMVGQNDTWILYKLESLFGGSVGLQNKNRPDHHVWRLSGENARGFLLTIFTYLSPRRRSQIRKHRVFFMDSNFRRLDFCRNGHEYVEGSYEWMTGKEGNTYKRCIQCRKSSQEKYVERRDDPTYRMAKHIAKVKGITMEEAIDLLEKSDEVM